MEHSKMSWKKDIKKDVWVDFNKLVKDNEGRPDAEQFFMKIVEDEINERARPSYALRAYTKFAMARNKRERAEIVKACHLRNSKLRSK